MSSRLQLDVCNLSLGRRHLVNAYEVKAGIGVITGNTAITITFNATWLANSQIEVFSSRANCLYFFVVVLK